LCKALEGLPLGAPQRVGIEIREPPAGIVRETEQRVSIGVKSRLPHQLSCDGLRLQLAQIDCELGVRRLFRCAGVLTERARAEGLGVAKPARAEQVTIAWVGCLPREED